MRVVCSASKDESEITERRYQLERSSSSLHGIAFCLKQIDRFKSHLESLWRISSGLLLQIQVHGFVNNLQLQGMPPV